MAVEQMVENFPFWNNLSESEKVFVKNNTSIAEYKKGAVIQGCKESCLGMIRILSGSVRVVMLSEEGREITLFHMNEKDSCILSASCVLHQITFETQMLVTKDLSIMILNAAAYASLMEKNIFVKSFSYELLTKRFSSVVHVMQQMIFTRFDARLAYFLLSQYEKTGETEIHMTQEAIAQEVNTAREVVARTLKQFSQNNLVEFKRGSILIKDLEALKQLI